MPRFKHLACCQNGTLPRPKTPNTCADCGFTVVSRSIFPCKAASHIFVATVCPLVFCASSLFAQTPAGNSIEVVYDQNESIVRTYNIDRQTGFPTQHGQGVTLSPFLRRFPLTESSPPIRLTAVSKTCWISETIRGGTICS